MGISTPLVPAVDRSTSIVYRADRGDRRGSFLAWNSLAAALRVRDPDCKYIAGSRTARFSNQHHSVTGQRITISVLCVLGNLRGESLRAVLDGLHFLIYD